MNYSASVIEEAAPAGSKVLPPSPRAAESAALGQTEKEAGRRAESRRLAIAAQGGCIESFESLVGQFEKPLYHFLLAKTRNHHQAEDLLQETFLITYRKLNQFNPVYPFSSWIFTIANRFGHQTTYRKHKPYAGRVRVCLPTKHHGAKVIAAETSQTLWAKARCLLLLQPLQRPFGFFITKRMTIDAGGGRP